MSNDYTQFRAFKVKFLGPTNNRGARITITEPSATRFEGIKSRKTFSYDYFTGDVMKQGINTLERMGFNVQGYAQMDGKTHVEMQIRTEREWRADGTL